MARSQVIACPLLSPGKKRPEETCNLHRGGTFDFLLLDYCRIAPSKGRGHNSALWYIHRLPLVFCLEEMVGRNRRVVIPFDFVLGKNR